MWHVIYPQYVNSELTIQKGRRLPKSKCVPNPNWKEMADILFTDGAKFEVQAFPDKCYPREDDKELWHNRGYIRYRCKDDSMTKKQVLAFISSKIPELAVRQHPDWPNNIVDPMVEMAQKQMAAQQSAMASQGPSQAGPSQGGAKKKKGRK